MKIKISDTLSLPTNVATQKLAFIGRTGSGKTYGVGKLVEGMLDADLQVVVLDPVGVWYGLRLLADGHSAGYTIPVFGGLKGDLPLEPTGGALVADLVVDRGISIVLDVSQFESDADKSRFATDFATRFFFRKKASPSAVHLVIEECQEFIPQNPQKGEERMLHAFQRMWKLGRNFGIGGTLVSQRPQEVSKKALNQTEALFAFQMTGPQERKAIELWMSEKGIDTGIADDLPSLKVGSCHVWSPQWLQLSEKVVIGTKKTFNSSSTPTSLGETKKQELAPIDLTALKQKMAETIERAKADDPKALRAEIVKLKAEVAKKPAVVAPEIKTVEVPVFSPSERAAIAEIAEEMKRGSAAIAELLNAVAARLSRLTPIAIPATRPQVQARPLRVATVPSVGTTDTMTGPRQAILDVVAMLGVRGIQANRDSVARWLSIHPNGGSYGTNLGWLRSEGYLNGFDLTEKSSAIVREMRTGLDGAKEPLEGPQRNIIDLLAQTGIRYNRDTLAEALGLHPNGGSYGTNLGRLRTMGLIPERGDIYLTEAASR